jgi:hypothetical protein
MKCLIRGDDVFKIETTINNYEKNIKTGNLLMR